MSTGRGQCRLSRGESGLCVCVWACWFDRRLLTRASQRTQTEPITATNNTNKKRLNEKTRHHHHHYRRHAHTHATPQHLQRRELSPTQSKQSGEPQRIQQTTQTKQPQPPPPPRPNKKKHPSNLLLCRTRHHTQTQQNHHRRQRNTARVAQVFGFLFWVGNVRSAVSQRP